MKNKLLSLVISALLVISLMPLALGQTGGGVDVNIDPEEEPPHIFLCDSSVISEGTSNVGRENFGGDPDDPIGRSHNYAFEGEKLAWEVLVEDGNGIENIDSVTVTVGDTAGEGNDVVVTCQESPFPPGDGAPIPDSCNAQDGDEVFDTFNVNTMNFYDCELTIPGPSEFDDEVFVSLEVTDNDGEADVADEAEFWFLNPDVALELSDSSIDFEDASPGTFTYSQTLTVGNAAEDGSGVDMDMFISGSDFISSSGGFCPDSNVLKLYDTDNTVNGHFTGIYYRATAGSSGTDDEFGTANVTRDGAATPTLRDIDAEGYVNIGYATAFERPGFYDGFELIKRPDSPEREDITEFSDGNVLGTGSDVAMTFLLVMPEPCSGEFDEGQILFWGEPV